MKHKIKVTGKRKLVDEKNRTSSIKPSSSKPIDNRDRPSPLYQEWAVPGFVPFNERYLSMIRTEGC